MKQTLYKKDTKGNIRFWTAENQNEDIVQTSGIVGTANPVEARKAAKAKNIGRANETTPEEQALKEVEALITKKLDEGYFFTIEEAQTEEVLLPMLAKDYFKEEKKIRDNEILIQECKLDGIRLLVDIQVDNEVVKAITRQGKELTTVPHLIEAAKELIPSFRSKGVKRVTLDGELYAGTSHTFQECMSLIKKEQPGQEILQYVVYDVIEDRNLPLDGRKDVLKYLLLKEDKAFYPKSKDTICLSPWVLDTKDNLETHYKWAMEQGYEGLMVKRITGLYKIDGRSSDLLKYKKFFDVAIPIIDVVPSDARPEHGVVVVEYNGVEVRCGMKLSHKDREEILRNKEQYIGKTAEIRYFELTDEGSLRFPVFHGVKLDA